MLREAASPIAEQIPDTTVACSIWARSDEANHTARVEVVASKQNCFVIPTRREATRRNLLCADGFAALSRRADSSSSLREVSE